MNFANCEVVLRRSAFDGPASYARAHNHLRKRASDSALLSRDADDDGVGGGFAVATFSVLPPMTTTCVGCRIFKLSIGNCSPRETSLRAHLACRTRAYRSRIPPDHLASSTWSSLPDPRRGPFLAPRSLGARRRDRVLRRIDDHQRHTIALRSDPGLDAAWERSRSRSRSRSNKSGSSHG